MQTDFRATLIQGFITATADKQGLVDVVIPSFDDQQRFDNLPLVPGGDHGPALGARVLIGRDNLGALWVLSWYQQASDEAPRHTAKHGRTGQTDGANAEGAVDARGVAAPSTAAVWINQGTAGSYTLGEPVPIAPWILPILDFAAANGWDGIINEGWRSLETQQYYWDNAAALGLVRGVTVAAPGTSNHGGLKYPQGALDLADQAGMAAAMGQYDEARKLVWYGPKDTPHWSANGR